MAPLIPVGIGALILFGLYESAKGKKKTAATNAGASPAAPAPPVAPSTPAKPPAPPATAPAPPPAPSGTGVVPTPPQAFPGFVGLADPSQTLQVGQIVNAIWANSALGASALTGDPTHDHAILFDQSTITGSVVGGDSGGVHVKVSGFTNPGGIPMPSFLSSGLSAAGAGMMTGNGPTVTAPMTVWVPA